MADAVLLFSGPPRSGKSTIAERVAKATGLLYFSPGAILKEMAEDKGQSFHEYFANLSDPIIKELSNVALEFIKDGGYVIDGRYEAIICYQAGIFVPAVYITAPLEVRAERAAALEGISKEEAKRILEIRERSEVFFSNRIFGEDYRDPKFYKPPDTDMEPLIIDTGSLTPDDAYEVVVDVLSGKGYLISATA